MDTGRTHTQNCSQTVPWAQDQTKDPGAVRWHCYSLCHCAPPTYNFFIIIIHSASCIQWTSCTTASGITDRMSTCELSVRWCFLCRINYYYSISNVGKWNWGLTCPRSVLFFPYCFILLFKWVLVISITITPPRRLSIQRCSSVQSCGITYNKKTSVYQLIQRQVPSITFN